MSCPTEYELFLLREGGEELTEERGQEVADHVASCTTCQAALAEQQALRDGFRHIDSPSAAQSDDFVGELVQRLDHQVAPPPVKAPWWHVGAPLAAALGCTIILLGAYLLAPGDGPMAQSSEVTAPMARESAAEAARPLVAMDSTSSGAPMARTLSADPDRSAEKRSVRRDRSRGASSPAADMAAEPPADEEARQARPRAKRGVRRESSPSFKTGAQPRRAVARRANDLDSLLDGALGGSAGPAGVGRGGGGAAGGRIGSGSRARAQVKHQRRRAARPMAAPRPQPTAIDPNGRFATTYRPGRGHLARFEQALLRGQVPEPALALVGEEGRGSGPEIPPPTGQALALDVRPGMAQLPPAGGPVHVAVTLRSTAQQPSQRPAVAVHLVMDTSGSMSGQAIEQARQAARQIIQRLEPQDRFSLVSYSTNARVVIDDGAVGPRRAEVLRRVNELRATGGTNLEAGLRRGYEQARRSRAREDGIQLVIVVSDGRPNQGVTDAWALSELAAAAFQSGVETTTIGVGNSYEPHVMSTIAEYSAGGYYYLPDASAIEQVIGAELDVRCHPVARGVELRVRLSPGVELLEAYGSRRLNEMESQRVRQTEVAIDHQAAHRDGITRDRDKDHEGGMRFFIPGFARDDKHTILLRLRVPAGSSGSPFRLADVELRYKDRIRRANESEERQVTAPYAPNEGAAVASLDREIRRTVLTFRTGQALLDVSGRLARNNHSGALALLYERAQLLHHAAGTLNDAALRADAQRIDAFRNTVAARSMTNPLLWGSLLQRASTGFMR